ncbi:MAG: MoaD/ThiS family protein [Candidatus Bathyarchaeia archaeon]
MNGQIKVLLAARFREIAGQREILEKIGSDTTLEDILRTLAKRHGRDFNQIIDSKTGQISSENWVMVNGKSVRRIDIELKENDVVVITVPAGGG